MLCVHCGAINKKEDTVCVDCGKDIYAFINSKPTESTTKDVAGNSPQGHEEKVIFINMPQENQGHKGSSRYARLVTFSIVILFTIVPMLFIGNLNRGSSVRKIDLNAIKQAPLRQIEQDIQTNDALTEAEKAGLMRDVEDRTAQIEKMDSANILGSALVEIKKAKTMQIRSALLSYYQQNNEFPDTLAVLYPDYTEERPKSWLKYEVDTRKSSFVLEFELSSKYQGSNDFVFEEGDSKFFRLTGAY